jgi:starch synthase
VLRGTVDPLLLSAHYARLTTVSEQYARELLAEAEDGASGGLGPALSSSGASLVGITNGIEPASFDPRTEGSSGIPFPFDPSRGDWEGKALCRERLTASARLPELVTEPLFGFIGRLTPQKGIDVLCGALSILLDAGDCPPLVVLGQGSAEHEERLRGLASLPGSPVRLITAFDAALARLIYAASDFFLIPSAFEPCGLTDFQAQLMGSVPLVHAVGGLVKVRDGETGFSYTEQTPGALAEAIRRCTRFFRGDPKALDVMRRRAFAEIWERHTWDRVAREGYLPLYREAAAGA